MNIINYLFIIILISNNSYSAEIVKSLSDKKFGKANQLFVDVTAEKKQLLEKIQKEQIDRSKFEKTIQQDLNKSIQEAQSRLHTIEINLEKSPENEFLMRQFSILKETYQVLKDTQQTQEDITISIDTLIKELKQYLDDPDFLQFKKEQKLQERLYYTFEDLKKLHEIILDQEIIVTQLRDQEKNVRVDLENFKRSSIANFDEYKKRVQRLQELDQTPIGGVGFGMSVQQESNLLQQEEQLYKFKKEFDELRIEESNYSLSLIALRLFIIKTKFDFYKNYLTIVKPLIRISEADVIGAKDGLVKDQQEYFSRKEKIRHDLELISVQKRTKQKELTDLAKQFNIELDRDIDEWSKQPQETMTSYLTFVQVGVLNSYVLALSREKSLLDVQITLEDEKFNYKALRARGEETYYKIVSRKFASEEEIAQERKKYDLLEENTKASLILYKEKINSVANLLNVQKKILDNIKKLHDRAQEKQRVIFKGNIREYSRFEELLNRSTRYVKWHIDILSKLTGIYSGIVSEISSSIRFVDFIIAELQLSTIWYRPEYAITWHGIKNIIPDTVIFFKDIRSYITRFHISNFAIKIKVLFSHPSDVFIIIMKLLFLLSGFFVIKRYGKNIIIILRKKSEDQSGFIGIISFLFVILINFIRGYFFGLMVWFFSFGLLQIINDPYLYIFFYLFSIPYLLYFSQRFMHFIMQKNKQFEYIFFAKEFQYRFKLVISTLLYATISIFFFRQAFMLSSYYRSELPTILLAVNFIIFQISLIFLITKEQILSIIPEKNEIWLWVREQVDQYYYLILFFVIAIIVMSNPYVGFGRLVLYLLTSFIYTALLVKVLLWVHQALKKTASYVFFITDDDIVRERFSHAKTWFGLLIVASLLIFSFLGIIVGGKIWGWQIAFKDIFALFKEPLLQKGTQYPITTLSLLQIIGFILTGFIVAYALNKFVLDKIFDLLLIDTGVQHTVTRFIQYFVVITAIFMGFQNVGLGQLIGVVIGALAVGIGFYIKDPISDIVAYFIILVQRPIKIGDYVKIDSDTTGVVRKITARAVIIRRKNSTTLVVPNSYVISRPIENWNYVRNFIAFKDILLTVMYTEDPEKVKNLLIRIVNDHPNVLRNPKPIVRLDDFSDIGYTFMMRGFISSSYTLDQWEIASDIRISAIQALRKEKIAIAVPVRRIITMQESPKFEKEETI